MSYTINYLKDEELVLVKVQGRLNFSTAQQYSIEAIKLARENRCKKFLLDHSNTSLEAGVLKIHTDGDALELFGFNRKDKIAIVISGGRNTPLLFETSDSNVKWSNFKYFKNYGRAASWLTKDK